MATAPRVTDNPRASRYELWLGATRAGLIDYRSQPGTVLLVHTEVDPALAARAGRAAGRRRPGRPPRPRAQARPLVSVRPCLPAPPPDQADLVAGDPAVPRVTMDRPAGHGRRGRADAAPEVTVVDDRGRCRHYAECVGGLPQVFDPTRRPGSAPTWSWTPPRGRWLRPGPRCAAAARPVPSRFVTAPAASISNTQAAPGTRQRHPPVALTRADTAGSSPAPRARFSDGVVVW
jgi:hypothetical protein